VPQAAEPTVDRAPWATTMVELVACSYSASWS
jgi:hypothetical protein